MRNSGEAPRTILGHIISHGQEWSAGAVVYAGSKTLWVGDAARMPREYFDVPALDVGSQLVLPGLIDIHIHGAGGADTSDGTEDALEVMANTLPRFGVTGFLPTTLTLDQATLLASASAVANFKKSKASSPNGARILGLHLEGPYVSPKQSGAQDPRYIRQLDLGELDDLWIASDNNLKVITLAPEVGKNSEAIALLRRRGVIVSLGHTNANYDEAKSAIERGATHATHTFNAMTPFHHREPGVSAAVLNSRNVKCEVIADGRHLHPATIELLVATKGTANTILVSDAIRAIGRGDGTYLLGELEVHVQGDLARLADGRLGGSVCPLNLGLKNLWKWSKLDLQQVVECATRVPATALGLGTKGVLAPGYDADITILDDSFMASVTIVEGQIVWSDGSVCEAHGAVA